MQRFLSLRGRRLPLWAFLVGVGGSVLAVFSCTLGSSDSTSGDLPGNEADLKNPAGMDGSGASGASGAGSTCGGSAPCTASAPLDGRSPWPKFRGNMAQTGATPLRPRASGALPWRFHTGKGIFSSPVVGADGSVYVGSADRSFYALGRQGQLRWSVPTGEIIDSAALLDDKGRVYVGSGDGKLRALEASTGQAVWTFEAEDPAVNKALIRWFEGNVAIGPDGTLYAPNDNFSVYALDRDTGKSKWIWRMNDQTWSLPAVDAKTGNLFIGNNYIAPLDLVGYFWKNIFALNASGQMRWRMGVGASVTASPLLTADGLVIMGAFDGYVRAYRQSTGQEVWSFATQDHIYASPALTPNGTLVQPSADGTIYGLDVRTGALRWSYTTGEAVRSSPAVDGDGTIYVGGGDGYLYVLREDGKLVYRMKLIVEDRNDLNSSPALGEEALYLGGENGDFFGIPYDYCTGAAGQGDPRCDRLGDAPGADGAQLRFTTAMGTRLAQAPAFVEGNEALTFSLSAWRQSVPELALLQESSLKVDVTPPVPVDVRSSGDRRFLTVAPKGTWGAGGSPLRVRVRGSYLVRPKRDGLRFTGGTVGGTFDQEFALTVQPGVEEFALAVPQAGSPATALEVYRLAAPLPTVLPSYNQIGFDSLHYVMTAVEPRGDGFTGWFFGAKLDDAGVVVPDPDTKVLFPVDLRYQGGLLTAKNEAGFVINAMNADIPFDTFRLSTRLDRLGNDASLPRLNITSRCGTVPIYGYFLQRLGFCNPDTDIINVVGSYKVRPYGTGKVQAPAGLGRVVFRTQPTWMAGPVVTATLEGATLRGADHAAGILLSDEATGAPLSLKYGLITQRKTASSGALAEVTLSLPRGSWPARARATLMVDGYPSAVASLSLR